MRAGHMKPVHLDEAHTLAFKVDWQIADGLAPVNEEHQCSFSRIVKALSNADSEDRRIALEERCRDALFGGHRLGQGSAARQCQAGSTAGRTLRWHDYGWHPSDRCWN